MDDSLQKKKLASTFTRKKTLQTTLTEVSQQMYARNKELAETNRMLSLLQTIDVLVLEPHTSLKTVCEEIAKAITRVADYPFVGIFTRTSLSRDELTLYGWSGKDTLGKNFSEPLSKPVQLQLENGLLAQPTNAGQLLSVETLSTVQKAELLGSSETSVKQLFDRVPLKSVYAVKLVVRRRLVGLLLVGFFNTIDQIAASDTRFLDRLGESIGVALDNKMLFEENQHVLRQLRESNSKLQALDEAKDDFISMASHQLRTPLTSVKGYISMVLEGDAGKITTQQRQMLGQAFFSSQRMVYLIADLLNVSRIRTGKFIIETAPVNLAAIVSEEISQLTETAKSRSVTLKYVKPKDFPDLMLDETKIRQVIMNFTDNAIYYTQAGGTINVRLINNPTTVELRVEDNGIGVPRSEQPHLFTKFYRAGNARKARPDGTGLGLYMAKKVIVGQGGAVIFQSQEGKGSTFGFTFSKSQLAANPATPSA